jgi:predicted ATPase
LDAGDPLVLALISGRAFDEVEAARIKLGDLPTESELVLVPEDGNIDLKPPDVGIGISQILPVVAASVGEHERLVLIEQPELHVHPRVQAELGDLFIETSVRGPHSYILETHSEHLILRIMRRIRETGEGKPHNGFPVTGDDVAVYYVSVEKDHTALRRIDIDRKGEFVQPWPDDFFEIDFYERFGHAG